MRSFLGCLFLVATVAAHAQSGTDGNISWSIVDSTLTISGAGAMPSYIRGGYRKNSFTAVVIENGVTTIGNNAFAYCHTLTSVTIPNSVISIEGGAFDDCINLRDVTIPNSVTSIGVGAFANCNSLTSIIIPSSVTFMEDNAFYNCVNLKTIDVDKNNSVYTSENGVMFSKTKNTLVKYPNGKTDKNYVISNSVTSIGNLAFAGCYNLISIIIPNSVTSIGDGAFWGCSNLTSVVIPNSVASIGEVAFNECINLKSVTFGDSIVSIGDLAFAGCSSLKSITIPKSVTSIVGTTFIACMDLISERFPYIETDSVNCRSSLISINVDDNNIAYKSENGVLFDKAKSELMQYPVGRQDKNYIIPNSVTTIGWSAFAGCRKLMSVTIPASVKTIGNFSFRECNSLSEIINHAITPQSVDIYTFHNANKSKCTLRVPAESIEDYRAAEVWKDFANIEPITR